MGAKIAVTIGIVSRGNEPFLGECLRTVASQNLDGLEVIVADISDEGGRQESFTNWLGKRQKCLYRHLPRCAAGAAKNYLLETAAGEYIAFLGEDICYLPGGLEKLYAQAKESGADMVIGRAAGGSFGGKEYPAAWTVDNVLKLGERAYTAEELGERALLLCKSWSGDKLFRTAYLRENGLRFSEGAFPSAGVVFGVLAGGNTAVSREAVLRTQDEDCIRYRKNPMKSATDVYLAILSAEEALKRSGKAEAMKKSFRTWCIEFAVWAYQMSGEKKRETREIIREKIEPWLKITEHGVSDYLTRKRFFKYCELCSEDDEKKVARRFVEFDKAKKVISIWGSCISREFFNVDKEAFCVNGYVFQCPMNIYYGNLPVNKRRIPLDVFDKSAENVFWERSSYIAFNKIPLEYLKTHASDYLVFDIADTRFRHYYELTRKDGLKTKINLDVHMQSCFEKCVEENYIEKKNLKRLKWFENGRHMIGSDEWEQYIDLFLSDILRYWPVRKMVLVEARFLKIYEENGQKKPFSDSFAAEQALACELERKIRSKLKEVAFLAMPQNAYGFQNDKINAHPLHYCRTVNEYKMQALKKIVFEHASNEQIQQLCDEYDKKLEQELNSLQPAGGEQ